jgi:copper homeostasis protein
MAQEASETLVLEVIACSVEDAIEASRGGAHRLEVISHFELGGLTPSLDLVREISNLVDLPLRVMLRESEGYEVQGKTEVERLCAMARELNALKVDGIVLGFLRAGRIDLDLTSRVLACAPDLRATFHHAVEASSDPLAAIQEVKTIPQVDRILVSGNGALSMQIDNLARYDKAASPEITVLAGGGLDAAKIASIRAATRIREFHVGRAARTLESIEGRVSALKVCEIIKQVR